MRSLLPGSEGGLDGGQAGGVADGIEDHAQLLLDADLAPCRVLGQVLEPFLGGRWPPTPEKAAVGDVRVVAILLDTDKEAFLSGEIPDVDAEGAGDILLVLDFPRFVFVEA